MIITTEITMLRDGSSNIFDKSATTIKLVDEGEGAFIEISQCDNEYQVLRFDFDEIATLNEAIKSLEVTAKLLKDNELPETKK